METTQFKAPQCKARVYGSGRPFSGCQCSRKAVKDGFCKTHHPDAVKARDEAARKRQEEAWARTPNQLLAKTQERLNALVEAFENLHSKYQTQIMKDLMNQEKFDAWCAVHKAVEKAKKPL